MLTNYTSFIRSILPLAWLWIGLNTLQAQTPHSLWQPTYQRYLYHDHKGDIDTLRTYAWKAFDLAREHQNNDLQMLALGKFINTTNVDSFKHYLAVMDTFPRSLLKIHVYNELELSYYRNLFASKEDADLHPIVEKLIVQADSVFADSLYDATQPDARTIYLLNNRKYLSILVETAQIDSKDSPFYPYVERLNDIVAQLPKGYFSTTLNTYLTTSEISLEMHEYADVIDISERVIQGNFQLPDTPDNFQDMKMAQASICYFMCYQQLRCYDHISDTMLTRNWAFIDSPYGHQCRAYLEHFGEDSLTPKLYYLMAKKVYDKVIEKAEKKIQKNFENKKMRHHFVAIQNEAIERSAYPQQYQAKLLRNFSYIQDFQTIDQQSKEIDYNNLFTINKLQQEIALQQLHKEQSKALWGHILLAGILLVMLLFILSIRRAYLSIQNKKALTARLRAITDATIAEKQQTEEAKMIQTRCLDNMNHEIRSPLNSIVGFSELLLENPELDTATKQEFTDQIDTSSDMLLQIINDVLDTAQLESGQYTLQNDHWPVYNLCKHALQSMEHRLQPGVTMHLDYELQEDTEIFVDRNRLLQILLNFLSNACKHTHEGHITLTCTWRGDAQDEVLFIVTDSGSGVPKDKQGQLFERFAKLNHKAQGTGLGLNISATLAHVMGAEIGYDSSYLSGARFYLILPSVGHHIGKE